ncbi:hypothetical protein BFJ70_g17302 [Fusarium oxysporum]|nr:hypothetical protein NW769_015422 [Fusarium oxysporum]KAJ4211769.1 hypothetical protein NW760_015445 [Fusarium oxysporum]RKL03009.1 hypothetical protein BFJ70_g17302 [Fusarium oxysporum]
MRLSSSITPVLLIGLTSASGHTPPQGCQEVCDRLSEEFPSQVLLRNQSEYDSAKHSFWSTIQGTVSPICFFKPEIPEEVSRAVVLTRGGNCRFAVKSGGHASFEASTIEDGLVIDLTKLNRVVVSKDRRTAIIEPGGTWSVVYHALQEYNLTVPGGRQFGVGVGGLALGGGISWLSNLLGWTCDNILEYEIVLADGRIVKANPKSHKDLFWALRGGGSNFGIVTKFKFLTQEQGKLWNGNLLFNATQNLTVNAAFAKWGNSLAPTDPRSGGIVVWDAHADAPPNGIAVLFHADTFAENTHPEVFNEFYDADRIEALEANAFHGDIAEGFVVPGSVTRTSFWTTSWVLDTELTQQVFEFWNKESKSIASFATQQQLQIQIVTRSQMNFMRTNGGNPTGLADLSKPIGFINLIMRWEKAEDDEAVYRVQQRIQDRIDDAAKQKGLYSTFQYLNYASQFQDPFASYGTVNKQRLLRIAKKYDPQGVFQTLANSGFKLTKDPQSL